MVCHDPQALSGEGTIEMQIIDKETVDEIVFRPTEHLSSIHMDCSTYYLLNMIGKA
jgi:hypothetical protein